MRSVLVAAVLSVVAASPGVAANISPAAKAATSAPYDWSGVYVGGHIGGGWQSTQFTDPSATGILLQCCVAVGLSGNPGASSNATGSAFLGGAQAGWMYQVGRLVIGSDIDWSATSMKGSGSVTSPTTSEAYSVDTKWIVTTTATVGLAKDHWLFYSKAGAAAADNDYALNVNGTGGLGGGVPFSFSSAARNTVIGWTVGTGVKWAFAENWFANVEYDYIDFGSQAPNLSGSFSAAPICFGGGCSTAANFTPTFNQHISEVKIGLSYKFMPGFLFW